MAFGGPQGTETANILVVFVGVSDELVPEGQSF